MKTTHRRQLVARRSGLPAFLRRSLLVLGVCLLLLLLVRPDSAQAQAPGTEGYWKQHFVAQINTLLRSPEPALRERGMELIIKFQNESAPAFDFSSARLPLYSIFFDRGNTEGQRILAFAALYATDSEKTSEMLAGWLEENDPSVRVRRHVRLALLQRG